MLRCNLYRDRHKVVPLEPVLLCLVVADGNVAEVAVYENISTCILLVLYPMTLTA
jgi:hypothetical protein